VSDTPRTDQIEKLAYWFQDDMTPVCESGFVRQLERELNAANERIKRLEEMYEKEIGENDKFIGTNLQALLTRELNAANLIIRQQQLLDEENLRLQEWIKRLEEAHSWRPIETALYDHTWVLGYDANDGETGMIIFDRAHILDDDGRECHWTDGMREWTPTHWMPLPEPPKAKEAKL
jgi:hypothetical protein